MNKFVNPTSVRSIGLQPVEILKYVFLNSKTFSFLLKKFTDTITVKQTIGRVRSSAKCIEK